MSCKGLTGTPLKNCKAKALKKAKAQAYALLKKRHPNMTKNDTLLVNRSLSKTANLENFTKKKIEAAVALRLKEKGLKNIKGKRADIKLIGTALAKSRKTTVKTTPRKKAIL